MESNKKITDEHNITGGSTTGSGSRIGSQPSAASATQRARQVTNNVVQSANDAYEQTKQVVGDAYDKTTEVLNDTYEQAVSYGRENPGKLTLIAFGAGIGIGVLLAGLGSAGRSRKTRIVAPIVAALSDIAMEVFR